MKSTRSTILALIAVLVSPMASADLIGDTIRVTRTTDTTTFFDQFIAVGAGAEVTELNLFELDFTGDSVVFRSLASGWFFSDLAPPAAFYDWIFADLDLGAPITALNFLNWDVLGLDTGRVSFSANSVTIDINNWVRPSWSQGDTWTIEFVTVPEPGTLGLLGIGLFVMGLAKRKRKI